MSEAEMLEMSERASVNNFLNYVFYWSVDLPEMFQPKNYSEIEIAQRIAEEVQKVMTFGRTVIEVATPITKLSCNWFTGPTGIYFLVKGREIVYVGQSKYIGSRVATHYVEGLKDFDRVAFIEVDADLLDEVETKFIAMFNPQYNSRRPIPSIDLKAALEKAGSLERLPDWLCAQPLEG